MSWTVKMWHFGQDALTSYSGEKFDMNMGRQFKCYFIISIQKNMVKRRR